MEDIQTIRKTARMVDWLAKIDLKDTYLSVPVREDCRRFLRFQWKSGVYEFLCLSSAPLTIIKHLHQVVAYFRRMGIRVVIYLDDILIVQASGAESSEAV